MKHINVIVAGATGYIGLELVKLLLKHPYVKIKYLCGDSSVGKKIQNFDKSLKKYKSLPKITKLNPNNLGKIDIIFTALPNGESQAIAKKIKSHTKIIDLSGDFRLKNFKDYEFWYKKKHKAKDFIKKSIYSLPELININLKKYKIISCPGCYPTSILIPLVPLIKKKLILEKNIIIDSKSGYSGAGRSINTKYKNKDIYNSISAYGMSFHKHRIEIEQELNKINNNHNHIIFTPHILPMFRGILSTIYIDLKKKIDAKIVYNYLKNFYKKGLFINFAKFNKPISTYNVMNTNKCTISICKTNDKSRIIILCAIDNLIKGGSGQAVQNMNLIYGLNEKFGF